MVCSRCYHHRHSQPHPSSAAAHSLRQVPDGRECGRQGRDRWWTPQCWERGREDRGADVTNCACPSVLVRTAVWPPLFCRSDGVGV
eukprot:4068410-Prymnesium_polylepis.1